MLYAARGIVLGYHGCDEDDAVRIIARSTEMRPSRNDYDWLGRGIYFWEGSPNRALQWAHDQKTRGRVNKPFVIGAALDLGLCLDLTTTEGTTLLREAYLDFARAAGEEGLALPVNSSDRDRLRRPLDCAVIEWLHGRRQNLGLPAVQSVRALLAEGDELYPGAGFREKTHTQLAIVDARCIRGLFRVPSTEFDEAA